MMANLSDSLHQGWIYPSTGGRLSLGMPSSVNPTLRMPSVRRGIQAGGSVKGPLGAGVGERLLQGWMEARSRIGEVLNPGVAFSDVYKPGIWVRKGLHETPLINESLLESRTALMRAVASHSGQLEGRLTAGTAELARGVACHSEPVLYRALDRAVRFVAGFSWREVLRNTDGLIQQLFEKPSAEMIRRGIPLSYKIKQILIATTVGWAGVHALLVLNKRFTPWVAKEMAPYLDRFLGTQMAARVLSLCPQPGVSSPAVCQQNPFAGVLAGSKRNTRVNR